MDGPFPNPSSTALPGVPGVTGEVTLHLEDPEHRLGDTPRRWLSDYAQRAIRLLRPAPGPPLAGEVRVKLVGDAEMTAAHLEYCEIEGTTDVLTFDMSEPAEGSADGRALTLDVDILACADEAHRQAAARGHEPARELLLYIVHGVLHCLGHDDHDEESAARMHAAEDRVLIAVGVGPTYSAVPRDGGGP